MSAQGLQRLDPIGTYSARVVPALCAAVALGYAVLQTMRHADEVASWPLAILALAMLVVACGVLIWRTLPSRALFGRRVFVIVVALAVVSALVSTASTWDHNRYIQDDWGQVAVAMTIFASIRLRPPVDLVIAALVSSLVVGWAASARPQSLALSNTPFVYSVVAAGPILATSLAAAAFSATIGAVTLRWQRSSAAREIARSEPDLAAIESESLYREQADELGAAALPLLQSILRNNAISSADIDVAASVSAQLRTDSIEQLRETWIDRLLMDAGEPGVHVDDADGVAGKVTTEQRAVFGAVVGVLLRRGAIDVKGLCLCANRTAGHTARLRLCAPVILPWGTVRGIAAPYLSILRAIAPDARLERLQGTVTIGFDFDLD